MLKLQVTVGAKHIKIYKYRCHRFFLDHQAKIAAGKFVLFITIYQAGCGCGKKSENIIFKYATPVFR